MESTYVKRLEDIVRQGGGALLYHYYNNSMIKALSTIYPEHFWNSSKSQHFTRTLPSKSQVPLLKVFCNLKFRLFRFLQNLLPDVTDLHMNYILEDLKFSSSGNLTRSLMYSVSMELDIFIPSLKIAFEYHGAQHYKLTDRFSDVSIEERKRKDNEKKLACEKHGITLIEIPYYWNGTREGFIDLVKQANPEAVVYFLK